MITVAFIKVRAASRNKTQSMGKWISAFKQVLSKYTSSRLTVSGRPNEAEGEALLILLVRVVARRAVNFSLIIRRLCSLTHWPNRSLELLENALTESTSPTYRNHCKSGLSASRAQNSRCASPVSLRAMLERSAKTLMRAKLSRRLALVASVSILRSASARLMKSCSKPEAERIRSMRSNKARCSR